MERKEAFVRAKQRIGWRLGHRIPNLFAGRQQRACLQGDSHPVFRTDFLSDSKERILNHHLVLLLFLRCSRDSRCCRYSCTRDESRHTSVAPSLHQRQQWQQRLSLCGRRVLSQEACIDHCISCVSLGCPVAAGERERKASGVRTRGLASEDAIIK